MFSFYTYAIYGFRISRKISATESVRYSVVSTYFTAENRSSFLRCDCTSCVTSRAGIDYASRRLKDRRPSTAVAQQSGRRWFIFKNYFFLVYFRLGRHHFRREMQAVHASGARYGFGKAVVSPLTPRWSSKNPSAACARAAAAVRHGDTRAEFKGHVLASISFFLTPKL